MASRDDNRILVEGQNCWRLAHADRVAVLVDADAYYRALAEAMERAKKSIIILGWDMDSRVKLRPEAREHNGDEFGDFINRLVAHRPGLHAHLLTWDYAVIFAFEREPLPSIKLGWRTHRRVHFRLDDSHPPGASHHQKIAVIDDRLAFVGGLDIAIRRWDTTEHFAHDPHRVDPNGVPYGPFHDVQMMVGGEAARALGMLARERWLRATGEELRPPDEILDDSWPSIAPEVQNISVGIARTDPAHNGLSAVIEVKNLYLDSIAAARHWIYIENQYFTCALIGDALAARLEEVDGPEVMLVLPRSMSGWIEEKTMGVLRGHLLRRLHRADIFDRLRVYYPTVPDLETTCVNLHSKVFVVDDRLMRVGSSNLSNRSMGLDTECDLAFEANGDLRVERAIAGVRNRLLGEHLGCLPEQVARAHAALGSLIATVESLRTSGRTLTPFDESQLATVESIMAEPMLADPMEPVARDHLISELVPEEVRDRVERRVTRNVLILLSLIVLAAAWVWTPLHDSLDINTLSSFAAAISQNPVAPFLMIAAYVIGGLVAFPVTLLIVATALSFGPAASFAYALIGSLLSAMVTYSIGLRLGPDTLDRLLGHRWHRLQRRLVRRGLLTMIAVHVVPVAPFTIINMVAGALRIRLRDLVFGLLIGMAPGILAISVFTDKLADTILNPSMKSFSILVALAAAIIFGALWLKRWLGNRKPSPRTTASLKGQQVR